MFFLYIISKATSSINLITSKIAYYAVKIPGNVNNNMEINKLLKSDDEILQKMMA
jgi:hypothetical protein